MTQVRSQTLDCHQVNRTRTQLCFRLVVICNLPSKTHNSNRGIAGHLYTRLCGWCLRGDKCESMGFGGDFEELRKLFLDLTGNWFVDVRDSGLNDQDSVLVFGKRGITMKPKPWFVVEAGRSMPDNSALCF